MISEDVGVVVIGRNEAARLPACLVSLGRPARLVYVDSGSTDDSVAIAERFGAVIVQLDSKTPFTAARARNEGFAALRNTENQTRFVQFLDGDCELDRTWLHEAVSFLAARQDVAVVCGRRRERYPDETIFNKLCDVEWETPIGEAASTGGDFLIRSDAFEAVGGFRSALMAGEEPEMCARLRERDFRIWRIDADMTRHDVSLKSFGQWWRRMVRSGYGYAEVTGILSASSCRIYQREVWRAVFWAGVLPISILGSSFFYPEMLLSLLIYPFQILRVSSRSRNRNMNAVTYAVFMMIAKFAELQGILKFRIASIAGSAAHPIEYKFR
jgi:glycosyltransferase involved in cell wall biosynthesis